MTITLRIPSTRSPGFLVPVALLRAVLVAPVVARSADVAVEPVAATRSGAVSCNALNFHPITSTTTYDYRSDGHGLYSFPTRSDQYLVCDANLPHGAVVTKVAFTLRDLLGSSGI